MKVCTDFVCPPIPFRGCDWSAWFDDLGEHSPQGHGRTKDEAVNDLIDNTPADDLVKWFQITVFETDTHRGPENGHWVAHCRNKVVSAPWREQAIADLAAKLIEVEK